MSSYIVSIGYIALKRIRGEALLPSELPLGRAGLPLNIASLAFLVFVFFFSFLPAGLYPTAASMNWSCLIYGIKVLGSLAYYWARGEKVDLGPVEYVRKRE